MIKAKNLRTLLKEVGPSGYRAKLRELLGVETKDNPEGTFPARLNESKAQIGTDEFSLRDLCEEFLGSGFVSGMANDKTADSHSAQQERGTYDNGINSLISTFVKRLAG